MYLRHILFVVFLALLFAVSCSNKEKEEQLKAKITTLEQKLDECKNGAKKLHASMQSSFNKGNFENCKAIYKKMKALHQNSELFPDVERIYQKIIKANQKKKEEKLKALKKLKKEYDDVSGITWYYNPYFVHYYNTNLTSIYIGQKGDDIWLRLKMSYTGDDWIFFEHAYLSYQGKTKEIYFDEYKDKKSDNGTGGVWEWIDVGVTDDLLTYLRELVKSVKFTNIKVPAYYLGGKRVSKSVYKKNDGFIYRLQDNRIVDKSYYDAYKKSNLYKLPKPEKIKKKIVYKSRRIIKSNVKMRLSGKYSETRKLSSKEVQGIIDVLNGYDVLIANSNNLKK